MSSVRREVISPCLFFANAEDAGIFRRQPAAEGASLALGEGGGREVRGAVAQIATSPTTGAGGDPLLCDGGRLTIGLLP